MHSKPTVAPDPTFRPTPTLDPNSRSARALHLEPRDGLHSEPALALRDIPDNELLRRLGELAGQSCSVEADLIAHIGEVDERRLYARQAFPSMYVYCTQVLHLSEAESYRRITVARAARRHAGLLEMLRDGRLHLTGMALVVSLLTPQNRDAVLARATHRSKREIEELVAELAPRPDIPSRMRKLPERRRGRVTDAPRAEASPSPQLFPGRVGSPATPAEAGSPLGEGALAVSAGAIDSVARVELPLQAAIPSPASGLPAESAPSVPTAIVSSPSAPAAGSALPTSRPAVVEPLSPARYKVQFTASAGLRDKLERLQALLRSQVQDGDLGAIIDFAVTGTLERLEARRFAKTVAPRKTLAETDTAPASRHIPAAVRRAVRKRDQDRCRFVDALGRRCSERHRLEFHHRHPFGLGGDHSPGNLSLMCAAHNRYLAEHDYGQAAIRGRLHADSERVEGAGRDEARGMRLEG